MKQGLNGGLRGGTFEGRIELEYWSERSSNRRRLKTRRKPNRGGGRPIKRGIDKWDKSDKNRRRNISGCRRKARRN